MTLDKRDVAPKKAMQWIQSLFNIQSYWRTNEKYEPNIAKPPLNDGSA